MELRIAENLKKLRKERGVTQEDLANFIGVSFQAVSKWERNDGYPDITMLPVLANYFGVSLDELVGMNELRDEEKRQTIMQDCALLASEGKIGAVIERLQEGLRTFPTDYAMMAELAMYLDGYGSTDEERQANRSEAIEISERILEFCTDSNIRNNVRGNMCFTLWRNGEHERAIAIAKTLPNLYHTMEATLPRFLSGKEKIELCQITIQKLHWFFWWCINHMVREDHYSDNEKIKLLKKGISFYQLIYDEQDYAFGNLRLADSNEDIAVLLFRKGEINDAFKYLAKCVDHCVAYDTLPDNLKLSSLMVNMLTYSKVGTSKSTEANACRNVLNSILSDPLYVPHLNDKRMKTIIARLEAVAN